METDKKKILPRIQLLQGEIPVEIPDHVYSQIKHLNKAISSVEWSGVLFYTVEGDIDNMSTFKIKLEYVYLMDKGSSGYTEYEPDEELVAFMMEDPARMRWIMGHIHSHNNMGVFFSGTDTEEIQNNSEHHNCYLSIITNNKLDFEAKVAFRGTSSGDNRPYSCRLTSGEEYNLNLVTPEEVVFVYDCNIHLPLVKVSDDFQDRIDTIIEKSENKHKRVPAGREIQKYNEEQDVKHGYGSEDIKKAFQQEIEFEEMQNWEDNWEDDYPPYWLLQGQLGAEDFSTEEAVELIEERINPSSIHLYMAELIEYATELYSRYFIGGQTPLLEVYEAVEAELQPLVDDHPFLSELLIALNVYIDELKTGG